MDFGSQQWMYASGDFTIDQSLRFNVDDVPELLFTPSSTGNRKTWTMSLWAKRSSFSSTHQVIFEARDGDSGSSDNIKWENEQLCVILQDGTLGRLKSSAAFRDVSAWYHIVVAVDTTQATNTNRIKVYVNNVQLTSFTGTNTYPSQNADTRVNWSSSDHQFGNARHPDNDHALHGYLAEIHMIDGTALTPSSFGEAGDYGEWKPKQVSGLTYGTNGYYLPFKQDYTVEGFSATTYKGNAGDHYIGGVGFQPDLVWGKDRDGTDNHHLFDTIRGTNQRLISNATTAENTESNCLNSFNTDGFTLGSNTGLNSTEKHVAWSWDMGGDSYGLPHSGWAIGGNINHSTTQKKMGATSIRFDGTDDFLGLPDSTDWDFRTNDFTIEAWVRFDATGSSEMLFSRNNDTTSNPRSFYIKKDTDDTLITRYGSGGSWVTSENKSSETFAANTWYHIAVTRENDSFSTYLNGSRLSSMDEISTVDIQGGSPFYLGAAYTSSWVDEFTGYMDEVRISNKCRYTSNFTAPTTAFSNDANTMLLIHSDTSNGSTTFVDSSGATKNTGGSITSYVAANATYGQSMVSYTGTGSNATIGHGLSGAPEFIIVRRRDSADNWIVQRQANNHLTLQTTNAEGSSSTFVTALGSSTFSIGTDTAVNASGGTYIAYCFDSVAGYSKIGTYSGTGSSGNAITTGFKPAWVMIKCTTQAESWNVFDNARNPTNPVILNINPNSSNAESDASSGNRHIQFDSAGFTVLGTDGAANASGDTYLYMAFADNREYAYWLDQSGNNNDFASKNLTESDISVDSPTNNFPTWNFLDDSNSTLSEGNLKTVNGSSYKGARATMSFPNSGKWYAEYCETSTRASNVIGSWRIVGGGTNLDDNGGSSGFYWGSSGIQVGNAAGNGSWHTNPNGIGSGDILQMAYDGATGKYWCGINNTWYWQSTSNPYGLNTSGNPAGGTNETGTWATPDEPSFFSIWNYSLTGVANFGQDSSFAGIKTAQGNQDSNGIGDFYYEPPTDFLALCTSNLPATITPSENFSIVTYTGDGTTGLAVTGVGFQADLSWFKKTNESESHGIWDAVRGVTKRLVSNSNAGDANQYGITTWSSDGFTVTDVDTGATNDNNDTYVAWNWKANGSGSSNTDGSVTTTVSANPDAGFSIVGYTGTGSSATFGHGLSKAPEISFYKIRSQAYQWMVYTGNTLSTNGLILNGEDAGYNAGGTYGTHGASTFALLTNADVNGSGQTYISYHFHSVDGYSKVGSYTGNNDADGTFVYTGFRPAYVLTKRRDSSDHWQIFDYKANAHNPSGAFFRPHNTAGVDGTNNIDILSNGFKLRNTNAAMNANGGNYLFLAFAETPFKYANAR